MTSEQFAKVKWHKGICIATDMEQHCMKNSYEVVAVNFTDEWVEVRHICFRKPVRVYRRSIVKTL